MTTPAIAAALPIRRAWPHRSRLIPLAVMLALLSSPLPFGSRPSSAAESLVGGGTGVDLEPRSVADVARLPREFATRGPAAQSRLATPFNSSTVTPNDSFLVVSNGFEDLAGNCNPRGWTGQDLTSRVYAHVSGRFTVNDGFVNMGTRALWFGADSSSALDEISTWVNPKGYGNGWSQRLTSPAFSRSANPGAVLRFDASMELRRNIDTGPTSGFTPYGLASGKIANDLLGVQALRADGSWAFLNGRFSLAGGPSWVSTAPLFMSRTSSVSPAVPSTMLNPYGVAVDDSGNVYVTDRGNHRVAKFTRDSRFITAWGDSGNGPGQFSSPFGIAVDASFNVYVTDANHRVQKFTNAGTFVSQWGSSGTGPGQFNTPLGIAADGSGSLYVTDSGNHRVQKFTNTGTFLLEWGGLGSGNGQLNSPAGIAVDAGGAVYVSDPGNDRVQKFTSAGGFITAWGSGGNGNGQFNGVDGIGVDPDGMVWVVDRANNRIQRFTNSGGFLLTTGTFGTGGGHFFNAPRGLAVGRSRIVYVPQAGNSIMQSFSIGGPVAGEATFKYEVQLEADGNQDVTLAEPVQVRIVMQSNFSTSSQDGRLLAGQQGVILVDNVTLTNGSGDVLAPVDFEAGTTGAWTLSAFNGGHSSNFQFPSAIRDGPLPATSVALRRNFDLYDPSCAWTFLSPGDTLANGTYARIVSPWIGLIPGHPDYVVRATSRLNTLLQSRFVFIYARGKNVGDTQPRVYNLPSFIFFGTTDANESASPLTNDVLFTFPASVGLPVNADSVQIVFDVLDQPERLLGTLPQQRPTSHLPIFDDIEVIQTGVDSDFDGVASVFDACSTSCAAGQDANADGCVDSTATLHHVESWASGPITYQISSFSPGDLAAIRAGFDAWLTVDGADPPLSEGPVTSQINASAMDGINLVTRQDPEFQFPPGVLAVTPTTSFTRRSAFGDRIVLPGEIVDSDMILNPATAFTTTGDVTKQDLQSVVTHEAGHLLGLSHTGVLDATMFFVIQPGEDARSLTDDDRSAVAAAYPANNLDDDYGTILGTAIRGQTGLALPGALIQAVRVNAGALLDTTASDYTTEDGSYALRRLPPGAYSVRITPLDGNVGGFPLTPEYISARLVNMGHTVFLPEWWSSPETDRDDPALRDTIMVGPGVTRTGFTITTTVDTIPPVITTTLPADGAIDVGVDTPILVNFSEPVVPTSLEASFRLRKDGLPPSIGGAGQLLRGINFVFTPSQGLEFSSSYEIEISPALQDLEGLALADTFRAVFTTPPQAALSITDIQPRSAPIGALITITGTGFEPESTLVGFSISALCSAFLVTGSNVTSTSLVVRVPTCTVTGPLNIVTVQGISNPFNFTVLPPTPQVAPVANGGPVALPGISPRDAAVSPDGNTVYAAGDGGLVSVDLTSPTRSVTLLATGNLRGLALTPDGNRLVTARPSSGDVIVMGATPGNNLGVPLGTILIGSEPGGVAVSPNGRRAFVTDQLGPVVYELDIDPASLSPYSLRREIQVPGASLTGGVAVSLDGTKLYLSTANLGLLQVDLTIDPPAVSVINPTPNQGGVAITPSGGEVLAPGAGFNSNLVLASIPLQGVPSPGAVFIGGAPRDVAVTPEGQSALVVNSATNELHVVDVDPGSPSYHDKVSTVGTGQTPLSVGISALSPVLAVANYADRSLSIYTTSGADVGLERVVPDVALPGDMVAVHSSNDFYTAGSEVDLAAGLFPVNRAIGIAVAFTVPNPSAQKATTLTLETPNNQRSLALPFRIVEPIATLVPRATGLVGTIPSRTCDSSTPDQGRVYLLRTSPDGKILAMVRQHFEGCHFVDFARASADGSERPGEILQSATTFSTVVDMAFTPDGKQLWVAQGPQGGFRLDADPSSVTFGQTIGDMVSGAVGHFPNTVSADPLNRYMLVTSVDPTPGATVNLYNTNGSVSTSTPAPDTYLATAVSRDGRYAVLGSGSGATFYSLETGSFLPTPPQNPGIDNVLELAVTTDGTRAVGRLGGSSIAVWNLDPGAGAIGANLSFGLPIDGAITQLIPGSDGHSVLVACPTCNTLYKLDVSTVPPTVTSADIGQPFTALTRSPDGRRLWGVNSTPVGGGPTHSGNLQLFSLADAATLSLVTGGGQSGLPLTTLPVPIRVRVTGANGHPQEGVVIRFDANGEIDGVVGASTVERISDVNGEAQVTWALPNSFAPAAMTVVALGGTADPLTVPAQIVASDAEIIPSVTLFGPLDGSIDINAGTAVFARFNQRMNTDSLPSYMHLKVSGVPNVAGTFAFQEDGRVAVFQPSANIPFTSPCTLFVEAGARDTDGQLTPSRQFASFTVQAAPTLILASLSPPAGGPGATVVISGEGFSGTASSNVVTFNGVLAPVRQASLTSLTTAVPINATSGPVIVQVGGLPSAPLDFTVLSPDPTPGEVIDEVDDHEGVSKIAFTPDGARAYVTNANTNSVTVLDIANATVITSITVGLRPKGIAMLPDGSRAYVANSGSNDVSVIATKPGSPGYNTVVNTINVGSEPLDIVASGIGPKVYVANYGSGTVSIIDANPGNGTFDQVVKTVNTGSGSGAVTISPDGGRLYVGTATEVVMVDLASYVVRTINTGSGCGSITISPDGTIVLALLYNGELAIIDATPGSATFNSVVKTVNTGSGTGAVTISPDATLAYVTSPDGNSVLVYQIIHSNAQGASSTVPGPSITLTLVATIPVGSGPSDIAIDPSGSGLGLVPNAGSGTITFIGLPTSLPPVVIKFKLKPHKLKIGHKGGKWVTGYLDPPDPYKPQDIVVSSILLNGVLHVDHVAGHEVVDDEHDDEYIPGEEDDADGHPHNPHRKRLKVKFLRSAVLLLLPVGNRVPVDVTGQILDRTFVGYDTVKVKRGKVHHPHADEIVNPLLPCAVEWETSAGDQKVWVVLMHSLDHGATWNMDATHLPNNGHATWTPPIVVADSVKLAVVEVEYSAPGDTVVSGVFGVSEYFRLRTPTAVQDIPIRLEFSPISPRPSHGVARMRYGLPRGAQVDLEVFDVQGRRVRTLVSGVQDPGWHEASWDGSSDGAGRVGSGLYYARFRAEGRTFHQRVVWLR